MVGGLERLVVRLMVCLFEEVGSCCWRHIQGEELIYVGCVSTASSLCGVQVQGGEREEPDSCLSHG
jgi:hypothetical protein